MSCKKDSLSILMRMVKKLPQEQIDAIVGELYKKLSLELQMTDNSVHSLNTEPTTFCKQCGSVNFVKNGKDRNGHSRYLCRNCGKSFSNTVGTAVFRSHKSADVWKKYISVMLDGGSIKRCASECAISVQTAFVWRHKILNALTSKSFSSTYHGLIEMDEMYVRISYKGNHSKSKHFCMPRKPFKRGSDNRIPGNNAKASVLCIVERDKGYSGIIPCRGNINLPLLTEIFDQRISDESIILTDGLWAYNQYFKNCNAEHIVLSSQKRKPTVSGPYHINNVNALQSRFRRFLFNYNGVSTKYLDNYLALFLWLENNRYSNKSLLLCEEIIRSGSYASADELASKAAVPALPPVA